MGLAGQLAAAPHFDTVFDLSPNPAQWDLIWFMSGLCFLRAFFFLGGGDGEIFEIVCDIDLSCDMCRNLPPGCDDITINMDL